METRNNSNLFEKILLCTDNSEDAKAAEIFALEISAAYKTEMYVLHLYDIPKPPDETGIYMDEFETAYKDQQRKKLTDRFSSIAGDLDITFIAKTHFGKTADAILDEAQKLKVSLLIIGTHGISGFLANSFGSNALQVIEKSDIPVLAIPSQAVFKIFSQVSVATKWLEDEMKLLKQFLPWIKQTNPKLSFIHVYDTEAKPEINLLELNHNFQIYYPGISVTFSNIKSGRVAETIEEHTIQNQVDCLILFTENKTLLERLFAPNIHKRMLYQLKVPILFIPR